MKYALKALLNLDTGPFDKSMGKVETKGKGFGGKLGGFVKSGALAAGAALAAFAVKGIADFVSMEKKAKEVFTLIPDASEKSKKQLVADATEISNSFGRDVTGVLDGMYQALSAGVPQDNLMEFMKTASLAAQGGVAKLDDAVGAITTVLNGYNLKADQAENVSDALFTTVKLGVTDFTELGTNIGKVTPLAAALGIEFDSVAGMFASLTKTLGKGQTAVAATQIKTMLAELSSETKVAGKNFKNLTGVAFTEFIAKGGDMQGALRLMSQGANDSGVSVKDLFGSIQGGMAALALSADGAKDLGNAMDEMGKKMGATKKAADEVGKATGVDLEKAFQRVKNAGISLGDGLSKMAGGSGVMDIMLGTVENLTKMFVGLTGEGKGLSKIFDVLVAVLKPLVKVFATLVLGFGNGLNVVGLLITVLEELIMTFVDMGKNAFNPVIVAMDSFMLALKAMAKVLADPFDTDAWGDAKDMMAKAMDDMVDAVGNWGDDFADSFDKRGKNISNAMDDFVTTNEDFNKNIEDLWAEEGDWAFLDPDKIAKSGKELKKTAGVFKDVADAKEEAAEAAALEAKKAREVEEQVRKQMELQKKILADKKAQEIVLKNEEVRQKKIKELMDAKKELADAQKKRQEEINALLVKANGIHQLGADIAGELLKNTKMTAEERKRMEKVQKQLAHLARAEKDATEEGMKALLKRKAAIEAIKEQELKIVEANLRKQGLAEKDIQQALKRHKFSKGIVAEETKINTRIKQAEQLQKKFNKAVPPCTKELAKVEKIAKEIPKPLEKAKVMQELLKGETEATVSSAEDVNTQAGELDDNLRYGAASATEMKDALNDIDIDSSAIEEIPKKVEEASKKMDEFNKKAKDNDLLKILNGGAIKINQNSPVPVKFDKKGMNMGISKQTIARMQQNWKGAFDRWKTTNQKLTDISKTLKGYFVNQ